MMSRSRASALLVAALLVASLDGCIALPVARGCPGSGHMSGRTQLTDEDLAAFQVGAATRADVLVRLGDADERREDDRVLVYSWEVPMALWFVLLPYGPGGIACSRRDAAFRFDDGALLRETKTVGTSLEDWVKASGEREAARRGLP